MTRLRSPICWFGGKGNMVAKLLPLFPTHHTYIEPFGGGASMLMAKTPSAVEVYNDLDEGLVGLFRVLQNKAQARELHRLCKYTPYARSIYNDCRANWKSQADPVMRAYQWFIVARWSFSGRFGASLRTAVTASSRGMSETCADWLSAVDALPATYARLKRVQVEQQDFRIILERYDTPDTLFYLDPPYVSSTRKDGGYAHELTDADHAELVDALLKLKGKALLSGYPNALYDRLVVAGWQRVQWQTVSSAAGRTRATGIQGAGASTRLQARTECAWISPSALLQARLFDEVA